MNLKKILGLIVFFTLLLSIINGAFPQLQLALFGKILIGKGIIKVLMGIALLLSALFSIKYRNKMSLLITWYIFFLYLMFEVMYFIFSGNNFVDVFNGINAYYSGFILLIFFIFIEKCISANFIKWIIIIISIPLSILGILQYTENDPILPVSSLDNSFSVMSYHIDETTIRAFSLFDSGYSFGHFLCLSLSIIVSSMIHERKNSLLKLVFFILISIATFMTLTRNIYIEYIFVFISVFLISALKNINIKFIKVLPILYLIIGYFINIYAPIITSTISNQIITDSKSLLIRQESWREAKNIWLSDLNSFLFGSGLYQHGEALNNFSTDNIFMAVVTHIGLIGLILLSLLIWNMWVYCIKRLQQSTSYLDLAFVSFLSTFLITGLFNLNFVAYTIVFMMLFITKNTIKPMKEEVRIGTVAVDKEFREIKSTLKLI